MGAYDELYGIDEERHDPQIKCWDCTGRRYHVGDHVPDIDGLRTYSVLLREIGGWTPLGEIIAARHGETASRQTKFPPCYVIVRDGVIVDVLADAPAEGAPVFDKWGGPVA